MTEVDNRALLESLKQQLTELPLDARRTVEKLAASLRELEDEFGDAMRLAILLVHREDRVRVDELGPRGPPPN